jgi:hypothetical protein
MVEPVEHAPFLTVGMLLPKKPVDHLSRRRPLFFCSLKLSIKDIGHPFKTELHE